MIHLLLTLFLFLNPIANPSFSALHSIDTMATTYQPLNQRASIVPGYQSIEQRATVNPYAPYYQQNPSRAASFVPTAPAARTSVGATPTTAAPAPAAGPAFDQEAAQRALMDQVNNVYGDAYNTLGQQEQQVRAGEQDLYTQFTSPYDAQRPLIDQAYSEGQTLNKQQQDTSGQQEQNALAAARRLYGELSQGVQQRFGGSNSAGEFANAFFGREFQRNMGQVQQTAGQNMQKLMDQAKTIQDQHAAQLQQLETQKQGALAQARNVFNEKLSAINNARLGLDQNKAQLKLQALQELRANVQNVLAGAQQLEQQARAQVTQAQTQLQAQVQVFRAQAGSPVDLQAIAQPYYSQLQQNQASPTAMLSQVYGQVGRKDEQRPY